MSTAAPLFLQIFRGVGGGRRLAVLVSAYFDESAEEDSKNGLLAVCGYVLDEAGVAALIPKWQAMLAKYRLRYFHMSECNVGKGIFAHLDERECDDCARMAIGIARSHPLHGHAMVVDQPTYRKIMQDEGFNVDPYTFMVWGQFIHVNRWVHENRADHRISLYFESGYKTEPRATELLAATTRDRWGGKNHVASYGFVVKEDSEPSQAADLIAWQVRKGYENRKLGRPIRRDTLALIEGRSTKTITWTAEQLIDVRNKFVRSAGSLARASEMIFEQMDRP